MESESEQLDDCPFAKNNNRESKTLEYIRQIHSYNSISQLKRRVIITILRTDLILVTNKYNNHQTLNRTKKGEKKQKRTTS